MSTAAETTTVVGYYNGNKWPIQLVISSLNVTLYLQPGEYIKDKAGRKINDPFFEAYADKRQLCREQSKTGVAVIRVPQPNSNAPVPHDGQSVRQVTDFTYSKSGVRVPVIPQPKILKAQSINKNSVTPMTIEEARKLGLVHRTREVPEDYGVTDTDSALPPRLPPPIKLATDLKPTKVPPLPQELLEAAKEDAPDGRQALVSQLAQQANTQAPEPDLNSGFANRTQQHAPPDSPIVAGPGTAPPPAPAKSRPKPVLEEALPEPALEEPPVEESAAAAAPQEVTSRSKYVCAACGAGFPFRSQLQRHASVKHKTDVDEIMANYPEDR